ncbi:helix-turn-helix domain-containing protein [Chitinimonas koreensis]|uniref:helix-turn-helix domain-containing protein n=1 Tax=Chitinimonas koreensis TaxID=356302 RepID=UPI00048E504D|nr:helix-turn-helix transcriptional regulator [Chitinimonas koreensis]QNM97725.1 helix-turn-helix transcriptional regulator [Chitinimonas koreensis]
MAAPLRGPKPTDNPTTLREVLAYNVRSVRVSKQLSQEQLSFVAGLDRSFISQIERAMNNVSIDNVEKIAAALAVEPYVLLIKPDRSKPD